MTSLRMGQFYKTKICPWYFKGRCERGEACRFAHSETEKRDLPDLSRTSLCPTFVKHGSCRDPNCRFAHQVDQLRATDDMYKTSLCFMFMKSRCEAGSQCRHAHGTHELRTDVTTTQQPENERNACSAKISSSSSSSSFYRKGKHGSSNHHHHHHHQKTSKRRSKNESSPSEPSCSANSKIKSSMKFHTLDKKCDCNEGIKNNEIKNMDNDIHMTTSLSSPFNCSPRRILSSTHNGVEELTMKGYNKSFLSQYCSKGRTITHNPSETIINQSCSSKHNRASSLKSYSPKIESVGSSSLLKSFGTSYSTKIKDDGSISSIRLPIDRHFPKLEPFVSFSNNNVPTFDGGNSKKLPSDSNDFPSPLKEAVALFQHISSMQPPSTVNNDNILQNTALIDDTLSFDNSILSRHNKAIAQIKSSFVENNFGCDNYSQDVSQRPSTLSSTILNSQNMPLGIHHHSSNNKDHLNHNSKLSQLFTSDNNTYDGYCLPNGGKSRLVHVNSDGNNINKHFDKTAFDKKGGYYNQHTDIKTTYEDYLKLMMLEKNNTTLHHDDQNWLEEQQCSVSKTTTEPCLSSSLASLSPENEYPVCHSWYNEEEYSFSNPSNDIINNKNFFQNDDDNNNTTTNDDENNETNFVEINNNNDLSLSGNFSNNSLIIDPLLKSHNYHCSRGIHSDEEPLLMNHINKTTTSTHNLIEHNTLTSSSALHHLDSSKHDENCFDAIQQRKTSLIDYSTSSSSSLTLLHPTDTLEKNNNMTNNSTTTLQRIGSSMTNFNNFIKPSSSGCLLASPPFFCEQNKNKTTGTCSLQKHPLDIPTKCNNDKEMMSTAAMSDDNNNYSLLEDPKLLYHQIQPYSNVRNVSSPTISLSTGIVVVDHESPSDKLVNLLENNLRNLEGMTTAASTTAVTTPTTITGNKVYRFDGLSTTTTDEHGVSSLSIEDHHNTDDDHILIGSLWNTTIPWVPSSMKSPSIIVTQHTNHLKSYDSNNESLNQHSKNNEFNVHRDSLLRFSSSSVFFNNNCDNIRSPSQMNNIITTTELASPIWLVGHAAAIATASPTELYWCAQGPGVPPSPDSPPPPTSSSDSTLCA